MAKDKEVVEFGDEVECIVTGYKGIAISFLYQLHGCTMVGVQPPVDKEGKIPESYSIDLPQLTITKDGKGKVKIPEVDEDVSEVELGDEGRDKVSGYTGVATARVEFMNGCHRIGLRAKIDKDGKRPDIEYFAVGQVELVEPKKVEAQPKEEARKPGGPMQRTPASYG